MIDEHTHDSIAIAPVTAGSGVSADIPINSRGVTFFVYPELGGTLTESDVFEIQRKNPVGEYDPVIEKDGAVLLGANRTEFEYRGRGILRANKILITASAAGVAIINGFEEA